MPHLNHPSHAGHCHSTRDTRPFSGMPVSLVCCRPKWHLGQHRVKPKGDRIEYAWDRPDGPTR